MSSCSLLTTRLDQSLTWVSGVSFEELWFYLSGIYEEKNIHSTDAKRCVGVDVGDIKKHVPSDMIEVVPRVSGWISVLTGSSQPHNAGIR